MRTIDAELATRLAALRTGHGWSLQELADRTGISRSSLSRLERGEMSPTAALLNTLCAAYGTTMSRLLAEVESSPSAVVRAGEQAVWRDESTGYARRTVSPPHPGLRGEIVEGTLPAGADIAYGVPPVPGLEQHIWLLAGALAVTVDGVEHQLAAGDCLRFRLWGESRFRSVGERAARYVLAVVLP